MESKSKSHINVQIYEEACAWFIEFRSGTMNAERCREADRWLRKSPEQLSAYLEVAAIWNDAPLIAAPGTYPTDELIAAARLEADNVVAFSELSEGRNTSEDNIEDTLPRPVGELNSPAYTLSDFDRVEQRDWPTTLNSIRYLPRPSMFARAAGFTIAAVGLAMGAIWYADSARGSTFATAVGEQRSFELDDGSTVSLNSRSKIRVRYSGRQRDIQLLEGQALFHVAKDSARPFIVDVNGTKVRAVGTEFDVYEKPTGTLVTVVEGRVAVVTDPPSDGTARTLALDSSSGAKVNSNSVPPGLLFPSGAPGATDNILLGAGEQLSVTKHQVLKVDHANVANATAWTHRELVFEFATLAEVAEEFNRYNVRPLVIAEPGLDTFHITGMFSSTDPASIIRFLNSRPGLRVVETPSVVRIERKI